MDIRDKATFKRAVILFLIAALLLACVIHYKEAFTLIFQVLSLVTPLIVGICMAFVFNVVLKLLENRVFIKITDKADPTKRSGRFWLRFIRPLSILLTIAIIFGIITLLIALVVPQLKQSAQLLSQELPTFMASMQDFINSTLGRLGFSNVEEAMPVIDWNFVLDRLGSFFSGNSTEIIGTITSITSGVFGVFINVGVGFVFSIYILLQKEKLIRQVTGLTYAVFSEEKANTIVGVGKLSNEIFGKFITGQFLEALILGTMCFIGMTLLSLTKFFEFPYALMISVIIAFTSLIPIIGAFVGTAFGALLILMQEPIQALWFILFIIVIQQIDSNVTYPKIIGKSIGLPGIWVLFAVIVGGSIYGILGIILGIPICSVLYIIIRNWANERLKKKGIDISKVEARDMRLSESGGEIPDPVENEEDKDSE